MAFTTLAELLKESFAPAKKNTLTEARRSDLMYTEKQVKKKLDRVIVKLEGNESGVMSRLAKRYVRLETSLKKLEEARLVLNERLKGETAELFDAQDTVLTRVVETVSFTLTLAKEIQKPKGEDKVSVDYESIARDLAALIPAELQDKIDEITAMYTKVTPAAEPSKPQRKISVGPNDPSIMNEGVVDFVKKARDFILRKLKAFTSWGTAYDNKLNKLKDRLNKHIKG